MKIRQVTTADAARIQELFEQMGFEYQMPDVRMMVAAQVIEDEEGKIRQVILARPTVELYFLADANWKTPAWRLDALRKIHESVRRELVTKGIEDVHCWLPPEVKSFGKRLMREFGWARPLWDTYTRPTAAREN